MINGYCFLSFFKSGAAVLQIHHLGSVMVLQRPWTRLQRLEREKEVEDAKTNGKDQDGCNTNSLRGCKDSEKVNKMKKRTEDYGTAWWAEWSKKVWNRGRQGDRSWRRRVETTGQTQPICVSTSLRRIDSHEEKTGRTGWEGREEENWGQNRERDGKYLSETKNPWHVYKPELT